MTQDHKCQICGADFDDEAKLEDHNRTMHSQYTCEVCVERLSLQKLIGKHTIVRCILNEKETQPVSHSKLPPYHPSY